MKSFGQTPSDEQLRYMIKQADLDDDGSISFDEFCEVMVVSMADDSFDEGSLKESFRTFDMDGNGYISASELKTMMKRAMGEELTDEEVDEMIREADLDGDGQVDFEEFCQMMG